ncbi:MAG: S9 family peptidase [Dokdonella sp.]
MRFLLFAALSLLALPAMADQLTIERIFTGGNLSGAAPRSLKISPDGSRVTFLRAKADDQNRLDLWEYHIKDKHTQLLVDADTLEPNGEQLTDAEKARRERARTASLTGIIDYQWAPDGKRLLFPLGEKLYLYDLGARREAAVTQLATGGAAIDPQISPKGKYVSYVRDQNLWVIDLAGGKAQQLTRDGGGTIHNGEAEFVAQEEMDRRHGYWWAPDDGAIAFERYDEAKVPVVKRFEVYPDRTEVIEQRYPAAGDPNVAVKLGVITLGARDVAGAETQANDASPASDPKTTEPHWIDLGGNTDIYLVRVTWLPDGKRLSYQLMQRNQQQLDLKLVDTATLEQRTLLSETSATWINLNDDLRFLKKQDAFVWGSERTGFHHLYLYDLDGTLRNAISSGDWNVDGLLELDEKSGLAYVSSNRDFAADRQIYALKLDGSTAAKPERISERDGTHTAEFADDASVYVDTFSDPATPPQVSLHKPDGKFIAWLEQNALDEHHPYWAYHENHIVPEFGSIESAGQALQYRLYKPLNFDPAKRYPVFDTYYGGPTAQKVSRDWSPDFFNQYMAQQGYVVFTLDNRGMARRGRQFSDPIYHQLGNVEVEDQVVAIHWLKSQPWIDGDRIGVFGWSYGGYMTTMLLSKASSDIAAGVAVAPVTDWSLYDTFYTERYLGRPQDNPGGYLRSGVFAWLDGLSSPLLLIHGMADDNVLFTNSTKLMAALQERETQFELMTYPGAKHGLSLPTQRVHVYSLIADFFERKLKAPTPVVEQAPPPATALPQ